MNLHNAIREIYNNAVTIKGNSENDIVAYDIDGNEISITDWNSINAKIVELQTAENAKEQAKIDAQASGNQKLLDLGLTQAEATALTGYTPPTEV